MFDRSDLRKGRILASEYDAWIGVKNACCAGFYNTFTLQDNSRQVPSFEQLGEYFLNSLGIPEHVRVAYPAESNDNYARSLRRELGVYLVFERFVYVVTQHVGCLAWATAPKDDRIDARLTIGPAQEIDCFRMLLMKCALDKFLRCVFPAWRRLKA